MHVAGHLLQPDHDPLLLLLLLQAVEASYSGEALTAIAARIQASL